MTVPERFAGSGTARSTTKSGPAEPKTPLASATTAAEHDDHGAEREQERRFWTGTRRAAATALGGDADVLAADLGAVEAARARVRHRRVARLRAEAAVLVLRAQPAGARLVRDAIL